MSYCTAHVCFRWAQHQRMSKGSNLSVAQRLKSLNNFSWSASYRELIARGYPRPPRRLNRAPRQRCGCVAEIQPKGDLAAVQRPRANCLNPGGPMKKLLVVVCSLVLAIGVSGCVGKAPVGKGKAPAPVVTRG